jgi:hypothetical protein
MVSKWWLDRKGLATEGVKMPGAESFLRSIKRTSLRARRCRSVTIPDKRKSGELELRQVASRNVELEHSRQFAW